MRLVARMLRKSGVSLVLFLAAQLASCDSGEPGAISMAGYEGPEGEALVRHLIATLPLLDPAVPKSYCVVKGPKLASTSMKFVERMSDLKVRFVSGEVLTVRDPDKMIVDPSSNLPPVTLQLSELKRSGPQSFTAVAGWAYKKTFERRKLTLESDGKVWVVTDGGRIEGNYEPPK